MKITTLFSLLMSVTFGLAVMAPLSSEAGDRRKALPDCVDCKRPVFSYYKFKAYENNQAVYHWVISGHSKCAPTLAAAKKEVEKKQAAIEVAEKKAAEKAKAKAKEAETTAFASHQEPMAYGGGSGYGGYVYGGFGYGGNSYSGHHHHPGCGHGGSYYGNPFRPGYGQVSSYGGYGYGSGTVIRTTRTTRTTPASLGVFSGFPGKSTTTYQSTTRTSVYGGGGYGGIRIGYGFGGGGAYHY